MNYYLAIDEGTSSARAIVFSEVGEILAIGRRSFSLYYPQPGWVEQEPEEIWQAQHEAVQEALRGAGLLPTQIAAVGITNQRETVVAWGPENGSAFTPGYCLAGSAHSRPLCRSQTPRTYPPPKNRPCRRSLLLRHQGRMASQRSGRSVYGGFWHHR